MAIFAQNSTNKVEMLGLKYLVFLFSCELHLKIISPKKSTALAFARSSLASLCACTDTEEDSLSNCSLNVSAASLDFLQTGLETFWLLVFRADHVILLLRGSHIHLKVSPPWYYLWISSIVCPPESSLFMHAAYEYSKDIANLHHSEKDTCTWGDHGAVYNMSAWST